MIGVRFYACAYLLYGMIVSRSWSGVINGELCVDVDVRWVFVGVRLAGYRQFDE